MKLVLDLQGYQTESRLRGIGRYSMALARGLLRNARGHDIYVGASIASPETIVDIQEAFGDLLPRERFRIWGSLAPTSQVEPRNTRRRIHAEVLREAFLRDLRPDVVHCSSVVEGLADNAVTTIGAHFPAPPTAATLYDLIPALDPDRYLQVPLIHRWYRERLATLRRADLLLAISSSAAREGADVLGVPAERIVNIRGAADEIFAPRQLSGDQEADLRAKFGLPNPFFMYSGGLDPRKNVSGLIEAFGRLPGEVRDRHQLAIVGAKHSVLVDELKREAKRQGLREDQVVFTGYVEDDDIVSLYNIAQAFVFPSHHEGFGLPPLEAMKCGTPTISADNSSLPEVVGNPEAMFDSRDTAAMAAKLERVLTDEEFRARLRRDGLARAGDFTWDETANRAMDAFEELHERAKTRPSVLDLAVTEPRRPRLALVTGLPARGTRTRTAVVRLIEELDRHYAVDLVTRTGDLLVHELEAPAGLVDAGDFLRVAGDYDRVVYRYADDPECNLVLSLQAALPGVVILEDYDLRAALPALSPSAEPEIALARSLVTHHGYRALYDYETAMSEGRSPAAPSFGALPGRLATGVIVTDQRILDAARTDLGAAETEHWVVLPAVGAAALTRADHGERNVVAAFGPGGTSQLHHRLAAAWLDSAVSQDPQARLSLVGLHDHDAYGAFISGLLEGSPRPAAWELTPPSDASTVLGEARFAVQLSAGPNAEVASWTAELRSRGIPVLSNDGVALPVDFRQSDLVAALSAFWEAPTPPLPVTPATDLAQAYVDAIEAFSVEGGRRGRADILRVAAAASRDALVDGDPDEGFATAVALAWNDPVPAPERQLLLDMSNIVVYDAKTGIQRVARNIARELLLDPPAGFRVELVNADGDGRFWYSREYTPKLLGLGDVGLADERLVVRPGDVFLGLDMSSRLFPCQIFPEMAGITPSVGAIEHMRSLGVKVQFVIYDLIPIHHLEWFSGNLRWFSGWLQGVIEHSDGVIGISQATADDVVAWIRENLPAEADKPVDWFHMGAEIEVAHVPEPPDEEFYRRWRSLGEGPTVLMVGTIEPRKGHDQVVAAFERLWDAGVAANLVLVGKYGWLRRELAERIRSHPQTKDGGHLRWFESATDAELSYLYEHVDGCLMASLAEGFGLPLIEAAQYGTPIICRDLPVFREVAGSHAAYFHGTDPESLATVLQNWFEALHDGTAPASTGMPWKTWRESAGDLMEAIRRNLGEQS